MWEPTRERQPLSKDERGGYFMGDRHRRGILIIFVFMLYNWLKLLSKDKKYCKLTKKGLFFSSRLFYSHANFLQNSKKIERKIILQYNFNFHIKIISPQHIYTINALYTHVCSFIFTAIKGAAIQKLLQFKIQKEFMKSGSNPKLDYVLVNLLSQTDTPSWQKALEYRQLHSTAERDDNEKVRKTFSFDLAKYRQYGPGVFLYFNLLHMLFFVFLILSINSIPTLICNLKGNGLEIYGDDSFAKNLMMLSLANQRYEEFDTISKDKQIALDIQVNQIIVIATDIIATIIFFSFLVFWKIKSDQIVEEMVSEYALPSYYTLEVGNLPETYSEEAVKNHFEKFGGKVAQVSTVYNYENLLGDIKSFLKLIDEYANSKLDEKKELYDLIQIKYKKIIKCQENMNPKPVFALVTYQDMILKQKVRELYKYRIRPENLKFGGKVPKVQNCRVEPASILWENFHLQTFTEIKHACFTFTLLFVILLLALVALFLVNAHATSAAEEQVNFNSQIDYEKDYTFKEALKNGTVQVKFNFCSKLNYRTFQLRYYRFCKPYFDSYEHRVEGMIWLSVIVITINVLLNWIIYELAHYRRYKSKTQKSRFLILNIFILYFVNSGLLMMLVRLELDGFSFGGLLSSILPLPLDNFNIEPYPDFNRKWYLSVGSQLIMIYAMSLLLTPFIQICINWAEMKIRFFLARRAKTQQKMNQTIMNNEFDFETFYALTLNCVFFTLFYANALPILYILAAISFLCLYLASAIVFRYFSCRPLMLDHTLNSVISKVMCFGLVIHQLTSILYFYTEDIFPTTEKIQNIFFHKLHKGFIFIIIGCILVVFYFNYARCCRMIRSKIWIETKKQKKIRQFHENFPLTSQKSYLSSYKLQDNLMYGNICYTMTILNMFSHLFVSKPEIEEEMKSSGIQEFNRFGEMKEVDDELSILQPQTNRPLHI